MTIKINSVFKAFASNLQFRIGNTRDTAQKYSSRRIPIQIKEAFTATHFLLVSPFLVRNHPLTSSPVLRPLTFLQIPYPILSRLSLGRNNCSRTMHLLEALHVRQQHDANRNKNVAKCRRTRKREKDLFTSSTNICALTDTGVFLRSFRIVRQWGFFDWCAMSFSKHLNANNFTFNRRLFQICHQLL